MKVFLVSAMLWACVTLKWTHKLEAAAFPRQLSAWGVFSISEAKLELGPNTFPYELVNPLFSDYALKFRTITLPKGAKIKFQEFKAFDFPEGAVISKTFAYPRDAIVHSPYTPLQFQGEAAVMQHWHLVETRLLVKRNGVWVGLPYQWNATQTDANLKLTGAKLRLDVELSGQQQTITYKIPNFNQCRGCHLVLDEFTKAVVPIGPKAVHLNREYSYLKNEMTKNQLLHWQEVGILEGVPPLESIAKAFPMHAEGQDLNIRSRSYLDINCAHCHTPSGPASSSGLYLDFYNTDLKSLGVCKSPVAVGNGGSEHLYDISPGLPAESILIDRLRSQDPATMMPEVGRSLTHQEGVALISRWIEGMDLPRCP